MEHRRAINNSPNYNLIYIDESFVHVNHQTEFTWFRHDSPILRTLGLGKRVSLVGSLLYQKKDGIV